MALFNCMSRIGQVQISLSEHLPVINVEFIDARGVWFYILPFSRETRTWLHPIRRNTSIEPVEKDRLIAMMQDEVKAACIASAIAYRSPLNI